MWLGSLKRRKIWLNRSRRRRKGFVFQLTTVPVCSCSCSSLQLSKSSSDKSVAMKHNPFVCTTIIVFNSHQSLFTNMASLPRRHLALVGRTGTYHNQPTKTFIITPIYSAFYPQLTLGQNISTGMTTVDDEMTPIRLASSYSNLLRQR